MIKWYHRIVLGIARIVYDNLQSNEKYMKLTSWAIFNMYHRQEKCRSLGMNTQRIEYRLKRGER